MSRVPRRTRWFPFSCFAVLVPALVALVTSCADLAAPVTAARPRTDEIVLCQSETVCAPPGVQACTTTNDQCVCDATGKMCCARGMMCAFPTGPVSGLPSDSLRRVRIVSARGPNPEGSFTTLRGERTLGFVAEATPGQSAPSLTWAVMDDPADAAQAAAPTTPLPRGTQAAADVPQQTAARWRLPHGSPLSARALAFKVVAELPAEAGRPAARDSAVVRQREVDVLRQEYVDFGIPVPAPSDVRSPTNLAGLTRFGWSDLNKGDYGVAVLTPVLLAKLNELDASARGTLSLSSVFRNPAHHRFHVSVSGGAPTALLSQHQYGTAVDIRTYRVRARWGVLRDMAKAAGACAEPLGISTTDHVHADWRTGAPKCPPGW